MPGNPNLLQAEKKGRERIRKGDIMDTILFMLAGLAIGVLAGYLAGRSGRQALLVRNEVLKTHSWTSRKNVTQRPCRICRESSTILCRR